MNEDIANDVNLVMQQVYSKPKERKTQEPEEEEIIHVHHFPDALVLLVIGARKKHLPETNIPAVESTPHTKKQIKTTRQCLLHILL